MNSTILRSSKKLIFLGFFFSYFALFSYNTPVIFLWWRLFLKSDKEPEYKPTCKNHPASVFLKYSKTSYYISGNNFIAAQSFNEILLYLSPVFKKIDFY